MGRAPDGRRSDPLHLARGVASGASGLVLALAVAAGIPVIWIWIASQLAGTKKDLTPSLAILITTGILVSYWLALIVGSWVRGRWVSTEQQRSKVQRMSWNRSFRDDAHHPEDDRIDPIERLFVVVAVIGLIAFEIWFFFFAGSPLPNQPLF
jgi:hypothetical protein